MGSEPIELGHPAFCLVPAVVSFAQIPRIVDARRAEVTPQLAVFSAIAHGDDERVARTALELITSLNEDRATLYWDIVMAALSKQVLEIVEAAMKEIPYKSEFARKYYRQGLEEGVEEGFQKALVRIARAKLHGLSPKQEAVLWSVRGEALDLALEAISDAVGAPAVEEIIAKLGSPNVE